ncbi:acyl-CoA thioesterase [Aurantiacibacter poecillastricola]|uniref:acyl-CoA thioesterase n=1 Tax=Aurantiacibacter poecillastricola TaxID=3064385 RepID=UPI002740131A|nr:acyl-CoA thioesterase domain-containing protein [Aurantiacibacter sp. 219JJ12-13]MDP5261328.1 thioesterase family protein [Aurantiacibacter sp. 219JJ12-13]
MSFAEILTLEQADDHVWTGRPGPGVGMRLFGGHALAQALMAACEAEENDRLPHSLHASFLRPGHADAPLRLEVTTLGEGRSFARRRVDAWQDELHVLTMTVSCQAEETGFHHADPLPDVGDFETARQALRKWREKQDDLERLPVIGGLSLRPVEVVPLDVESLFGNTAQPPRSAIWMRARPGEWGSPFASRAQLAYASDMLFLRNALLPHGVRPGEDGVQIASLDHTIWFHETPDFSQWHLYATESPWAGGARGLSLGHFFSQDGRMIATVAQENLMRVTDGRLDHARD